jgi:hypothetical protein
MSKNNSQFNFGMQPVFYSPLLNSWSRIGENISYYTNNYQKDGANEESCFASLQFSITFTAEEFRKDSDICFLAYHYPFTYTNLLESISFFKKKHITGVIPMSIGQLDNLQKLYLQDNFLKGNLPLSMSNISSLHTVNISNNLLSGVMPFRPSFELIGIESNFDLSLPIELPTIIESPTETPDRSQNISTNESDISLPIIIGVSAALILFVLLVIAAVILLKRREQGRESDIELRLLPKYSSTNKQIRLMRMLNIGGFGVVWKARYKGQTVAIKLIRMDKFEGKQYDNERNVNIFKMVVDEASIMELMVHERIVRFIMFEIESLGIVLEYLPLGSLYDYIENSHRVMPWTNRHQMMLDICEGMEFLHSNVYPDGSMKKVLFHQDLKSGNVLMCMEGTPPTLRGKVSDFGLSCKFLFHLTLESSPERQSDK